MSQHAIPPPVLTHTAGTSVNATADVAPTARQRLAHLGPNWFASVMGTGIVANAAALLPVHSAALHSIALAVWVLAAGLLAVLLAATAAHWLLHTEQARAHHSDPAMAPFYGAPPMAMLTVGAGALLLGKQLVGLPAAVRVDEVLWSAGTITGLLSTIAIPYLMFTRHELHAQDTLGSWLMPVVPRRLGRSFPWALRWLSRRAGRWWTVRR